LSKFRKKPSIKFERPRSTSKSGINSAAGRKYGEANMRDTGEGGYADTKIPIFDIASKSSAEEADEAFLLVSGVMSKLEQAMNIARVAPKASFIPVDSASRNIRQAVMRRDRTNAPEGDKIHWDLFERIINHAVNQYDFVNFEFLDNLQNEPYSDTVNWNANQIINDLMQDGNDMFANASDTVGDDDLTPGQYTAQFINNGLPQDKWSWLRKLLLYSAPLIYLYFDYKLKGPLKSLDDAGVAGGKMPAGTEYGTIIVQILIGIAIYLLIQGLTAQQMKDMLRDAGFEKDMKKRGIPADLDNLCMQAQSLLNGDSITLDGFGAPGKTYALGDLPLGVSVEFLHNATAYMGQGDWEIMRDYCVGFLMNHLVDDEYYPWHMYLDSRIGYDDLEGVIEQAPSYSPLFRVHAINNDVTINNGGSYNTNDPDFPLTGNDTEGSREARAQRNSTDYSKKFEAPSAMDAVGDALGNIGDDLLDTVGEGIEFGNAVDGGASTIDDYTMWKMMTVDAGQYGYIDWKGEEFKYTANNHRTPEQASRMNAEAEKELRERYQNRFTMARHISGIQEKMSGAVKGAGDYLKMDLDKLHWTREIAWVWNKIVESLVANLSWQDWYKEFLCCFIRAIAYYNPAFISVLKELLRWATMNMTINYGEMLKKLYDKFWVSMIEEFKKALHTMLDEAWQNVLDTYILPFIETNTQGEENEYCYLWKMLLEALLNSMKQFKAAIDAIIDDLFKRLIINSDIFNQKLVLRMGCKYLDMFAKLLDKILEFAEECGLQETEEGLAQLESWLSEHGLSTFNQTIPSNLSPDAINALYGNNNGEIPDPSSGMDGIADMVGGIIGVSDVDDNGNPISETPVEQRTYNSITAYGHKVDIPVKYQKAAPTNSWWFGEPIDYDGLIVMPVSALLEKKYKDKDFAEEQKRRCRDQLTPERMKQMVKRFPRNMIDPRINNRN